MPPTVAAAQLPDGGPDAPVWAESAASVLAAGAVPELVGAGVGVAVATVAGAAVPDGAEVVAGGVSDGRRTAPVPVWAALDVLTDGTAGKLAGETGHVAAGLGLPRDTDGVRVENAGVGARVPRTRLAGAEEDAPGSPADGVCFPAGVWVACPLTRLGDAPVRQAPEVAAGSTPPDWLAAPEAPGWLGRVAPGVASRAGSVLPSSAGVPFPSVPAPPVPAPPGRAPPSGAGIAFPWPIA